MKKGRCDFLLPSALPQSIITRQRQFLPLSEWMPPSAVQREPDLPLTDSFQRLRWKKPRSKEENIRITACELFKEVIGELSESSACPQMSRRIKIRSELGQRNPVQSYGNTQQTQRARRRESKKIKIKHRNTSFFPVLVFQTTNRRTHNLKHFCLLSHTKRLHHFPCKTTSKLQGKKRWVGAKRPPSQSLHCDNTPGKKKPRKHSNEMQAVSKPAAEGN